MVFAFVQFSVHPLNPGLSLVVLLCSHPLRLRYSAALFTASVERMGESVFVLCHHHVLARGKHCGNRGQRVETVKGRPFS